MNKNLFELALTSFLITFAFFLLEKWVPILRKFKKRKIRIKKLGIDFDKDILLNWSFHNDKFLSYFSLPALFISVLSSIVLVLQLNLDLGTSAYLSLLIYNLMISALFEELFFRGWILGGLMKKYPDHTIRNILIHSLIFTAAHIGHTPVGFLNVFISSIIYAVVYLKVKGDLTLPTLLHVTANSSILIGILLRKF